MIDPGSVVLVVFPGAHKTKARPAVVLSTALHQTTQGDVVLGVLTGNIARQPGRPTTYSRISLRRDCINRLRSVSFWARNRATTLFECLANSQTGTGKKSRRLRLALAVT